ncbi:carbamoyltransferase HypF [Helicobacter anatolicus]|uniref:carbamoyltransferase HypF n=1 Tax=Helicobacter anatolicus TaxID=2905874 RepID=UPI001E4F0BDA|nr:carbamoyltransferase HypF [Helicobacter anatolicus]MCE3038179.1 carbamoyltransferase HypF [Helicobacter anatolicus]
MIFYKIRVEGRVQGVGFRPYVYLIAQQLKIYGYVKNRGNYVEILIDKNLDSFLETLQNNLPPQALITSLDYKKIIIQKKYSQFDILDSKDAKTTLKGILPQDLKICKDCLQDLKNHQRFYQYAFNTCTNCGPRYSILYSLPYDRKNTSMRDFGLCKDCLKDYQDPNNRRFHAQTLSCKNCTISLSFYHKDTHFHNDEAIHACAMAILEGKIVAIKGVGGFTLCCDATNSSSIKRLRNLKNRPKKPFAIMLKDLDSINEFAEITPLQKKALLSKEAPIVLLQKKQPLQEIAPNLKQVGVILPYSSLHHLLMEKINRPIVFTSANLNGEPIITTEKELLNKLGNVFDAYLTHGREIINPIDDSVVQQVGEGMQIIRLARGYAPLHLHFTQLNENKDTLIGMGAEQKVTLAYKKEGEVIVSPYIGDLNNPTTLARYEKNYNFFTQIYQLEPKKIISDLHQNYHSYQISKNLSCKNNILWEKKQHHYAHFCAIFADSLLQDKNLKIEDKVLGVIWDGTGLGKDGKIWGGEFIFGNLKNYKRVGHFENMEIYGGEKSIKEIYKIAYSLVRQFGDNDDILWLKQKYIQKYPKIFPFFDTVIDKKLHVFHTTSVGRIFDAMACLCEICDYNSYDCEAPIMLEQHYKEEIKESYHFLITSKYEVCIKPMMKEILKDLKNNEAKEKIVSKFINTLVAIIFKFAHIMQTKTLMFSGGVFMNKALCEAIIRENSKHTLRLFFHQYLPSNDSNISLGQVISIT